MNTIHDKIRFLKERTFLRDRAGRIITIRFGDYRSGESLKNAEIQVNIDGKDTEKFSPQQLNDLFDLIDWNDQGFPVEV